MGKPVVRIGVRVDQETWNTLLKVEQFKGLNSVDFLIDTSEPSIWLYFVGENENLLGRVHDVSTKAGGLPMKSGGEWRDSAERFHEYFRAAVNAQRAQARLKGGVPLSEHSMVSEGVQAATRDLAAAKARFEAALATDARKVAELDESIPAEPEYSFDGPPN